MSYRCQVCDSKVPAGTPLRRHIVYRDNGQIVQEIPVCLECEARITKYSLAECMQRRSTRAAYQPPSPALVEAPAVVNPPTPAVAAGKSFFNQRPKKG